MWMDNASSPRERYDPCTTHGGRARANPVTEFWRERRRNAQRMLLQRTRYGRLLAFGQTKPRGFRAASDHQRENLRALSWCALFRRVCHHRRTIRPSPNAIANRYERTATVRVTVQLVDSF